MYDRWFNHAGTILAYSDYKVEKVRTVVWNSVVRPRHVLHLFYDPLLSTGRLHPHTTQQLYFNAVSITGVWLAKNDFGLVRFFAKTAVFGTVSVLQN